MRIGIDATATPLNRAGAGNYIFNLVAGLAQIDADNQYYVFAKPFHIAEWNIHQSNFYFLPSASDYRPLRLTWEQCVLPMLLRHYRIDVMHSPHYTMPLFCPCRSVVTFCDMIFFLHPEVHRVSKRIFFRTMMAASSRRADAIIAISESTACDVRKLLNVRPDKVHTVPLGAGSSYQPISDRTAIDRVCNRYGLQAGEYVLFTGVLEPRKNIPVLLRAYHEVTDRGICKKLAIVGKKGWMFDEIFAAVRSLRLEDTVVFTGYVPDEDLPALYNGACLFVYPSLYEGFGLPVLEAMACGTPVVTSNVSSMPEIVGNAGLLVDPHDAHCLADEIAKLIANTNLRHSLRQRGLERAALYSWETTARNTLKVYQQICN